MGTKALATTIAVTTLWAGSFLVSKLFFSAEAALGKSAAFGVFSVCNMATVVFVVAWQLYQYSNDGNVQMEKPQQISEPTKQRI